LLALDRVAIVGRLGGWIPKYYVTGFEVAVAAGKDSYHTDAKQQMDCCETRRLVVEKLNQRHTQGLPLGQQVMAVLGLLGTDHELGNILAAFDT